MLNKALTRPSLLVSTLLAGSVFLLSACAPEVGSDAWCKKLAAKPKGDWTVNEATDYTKHCLLK